jgi:hypothetical protein
VEYVLLCKGEEIRKNILSGEKMFFQQPPNPSEPEPKRHIGLWMNSPEIPPTPLYQRGARGDF